MSNVYQIIKKEYSMFIKPTEETIEKIRSLYAKGKNYHQIMNTLNVGERTVRRYLGSKIRTKQQIAEMHKLLNKDILNEQQTQLILGTMLGDGCLMKINGSYVFQTNHGPKQLEYNEYQNSLLNKTRKLRIKTNKAGFGIGSQTNIMIYQNKGALEDVWNLCMINNKKTINQNWLNKLTVEGLSYWFMDDGSSIRLKNGQISIRISTQGFPVEEQLLLIEMLKKFKYDARLDYSKGGFGKHITFKRKSSDKFVDDITPHVSKIPCMMYKLKHSVFKKKNISLY